MNEHTPGPLRFWRNHNPAPAYSTSWTLDSSSRRCLAIMEVHDLNSSAKWRAANPQAVAEHAETMREVEANARLIPAAFNAFDKAARTLGRDATALAEQLDIAEALRLLREAIPLLERLDYDNGPDAPEQAAALIAAIRERVNP